MVAFCADSVNLGHLGPRTISYEPKQIFAEAILVTPENIGKLSLEFETELFINLHNGLAYFYITVARKLEQDEPGQMTGTTRLTVRVHDWIVPLRNEIHLYPDELFRNTFVVEGGGPLPTLPDLMHEVGEEHRKTEIGL